MMNTAPLRLTLTASSDEQFVAGMTLQQRMFGLGAVVILMMTFQIGGLIAAFILAALSGQPPGDTVPISVAAALGGSCAFIAYQNWMVSRIRKELARSALRRAPTTAVLSTDGLALTTQTLPWSAITRTERLKDATLICFSRLDAILIRDVDLPPDLPPDTLQTQLDLWRKAPQP